MRGCGGGREGGRERDRERYGVIVVDWFFCCHCIPALVPATAILLES